MSGMHRSYTGRRAKRHGGAGRLALAGGLVGILGIGAVAAGIIVLRPDDRDGRKAGTTGTAQSQIRAPQAGKALTFTTPEGYGYSLAAVARGIRQATGSGGETTVAYADYILTNTRQEAVLLEFPADLFIQQKKVPGAASERCMPQPGTSADMCTLPSQTKVIAGLNGSEPPTTETGGERFIPGGASYLVRVITDFPVAADTGTADLKLYVWNVRFKPDRKAVEIMFP